MATHTTLSASASIHPNALSSREVSIINTALDIIEEKCLRKGPVLDYLEDFERYLVMRFAGHVNEQGHVMYLDCHHRLLSADTEFFGNQSRVGWDMRKVVQKALILGAEHLVFAHNHPGDSSTPSEGDVQHLKWSMGILQPLNINLLDSFVVTNRGITSIKKYSQQLEEERTRQRSEECRRRDAERRAKRAANKAAKLATQQQGATA